MTTHQPGSRSENWRPKLGAVGKISTRIFELTIAVVSLPRNAHMAENENGAGPAEGVEMGEGAWEKVETTEVERQSIRKQEKEDAFKILKEFDLMEYVVCVCVFCVGRGWWGL